MEWWKEEEGGGEGRWDKGRERGKTKWKGDWRKGKSCFPDYAPEV